jgi:hypothetical protein
MHNPMQCKWQIEFKFHKLIMWVSELLMTVSTASIPVLDSAEVVHLYPQVVLPILPWGWSDPIHLYQGSEGGYHYETFTKFH